MDGTDGFSSDLQVLADEIIEQHKYPDNSASPHVSLKPSELLKSCPHNVSPQLTERYFIQP